MAVTLSSFLVAFPEFAGAPSALVQAKINEAILCVDSVVWGPKADIGVSYLAAHLLVQSPAGQNARMLTKDGNSTYKTFYELQKTCVASGYRVI